jgi:hypothetical protein
MWPAFVVLTIADGLILHWLPPIRTGVDVIPGILLATFGNLLLVGAIAPWLARRMHARRPAEAPLDVTTDRVGTTLLVASVFAVLAAGLAARPTVVVETEDREQAANAIHVHVQRSGDPELIRNEEASDTIRLADGYFRTCIPRDDRRRFTCFFVDANKEPASVVRDRSAEPNSQVKRR